MITRSTLQWHDFHVLAKKEPHPRPRARLFGMMQQS
jgi:hypothetical protein